MTENGKHSDLEHDHSKVAYTAWGVAYLRTFSDIPLTREFFEVIESHLSQSDELAGKWVGKKDRLAPQLEARYKLVDKLLKTRGTSQIIELAAGLAPRGMNFSRSNPESRYVELDLSSVVKEKLALVKDLGLGMPPNLAIVEGDVLNPIDIDDAISSFSHSIPITVVNEGLLRYFTFDEKARVAHSIHSLLERFGGVWITPDISLRSALEREDEVVSGHIQSLEQGTGIDINQNVFENEEHGREFFEDLGFKIEPHKYLEVTDELVSPNRVGMSRSEVERLNGVSTAFIMTVDR